MFCLFIQLPTDTFFLFVVHLCRCAKARPSAAMSAASPMPRTQGTLTSPSRTPSTDATARRTAHSSTGCGNAAAAVAAAVLLLRRCLLQHLWSANQRPLRSSSNSWRLPLLHAAGRSAQGVQRLVFVLTTHC
jgi:hypothetical protein